MAALDLFNRLATRRPPATPKPGSNELERDVERLTAWLLHSGRSSICLRDICYLGPNSLRRRAKAIVLAELLTARGILVRKKAHRYDRFEWFVRGAGGHSNVTAASRHYRPAEQIP
jgi:hypothetical protein